MLVAFEDLRSGKPTTPIRPEGIEMEGIYEIIAKVCRRAQPDGVAYHDAKFFLGVLSDFTSRSNMFSGVFDTQVYNLQ